MIIDSPDRALGRAMRPYWARFSLANPKDSAQLRMLAPESTTQFDTRLFERGGDGRWVLVGSVADASGGAIGGGSINPL